MFDLFAQEEFIYLSGDGESLLVKVCTDKDEAGEFITETKEKLHELIPSVRKCSKTKDWKVPMSSDMVKLLGKLKIPFTGEAAQYEARLIEREERAHAASALTEADLDLPGFGVELRPYQRAGVLYATERKRVIIADEMGLGKTFQGLASVYALNAFPCLVVAPASNKYMWAETEIPRALPNHRVILADKKTKLKDLQKADIIVTNYHQMVGFKTYEYQEKDAQGNCVTKTGRTVWKDSTKKDAIPSELAQHLANLRLQSIILDEAQNIKSTDTSWTKVLCKMRFGVPVRLPMTGTAVQNGPKELVPILRFIDRLDEFGGSWEFWHKYCDYKEGGPEGVDISGSSNETDLNDKLRKYCWIRRLKKDVLTELPELTRTTVLCDIDNRAEYEHAEKELIQWVKDRVMTDEKFMESIKHLTPEQQHGHIELRKHDKANAAKRNEKLVKITALKKVAAEGKLKAAKQWIDDFLTSGEALLLFATSKFALDYFIKSYPGEPHLISEMPPEVRQRNVQRFQNDLRCKLMTLAQGTSASSSPGGVGHTITRASNVFTFELGWTMALHEQCEGRSHRMGQRNAVNSYYFIARNTIEMKIAKLLEHKREVGSLVMDGVSIKGDNDILDELIDWIASL